MASNKCTSLDVFMGGYLFVKLSELLSDFSRLGIASGGYMSDKYLFFPQIIIYIS
jgi:hypothetical protein